MKVTTLKRTIIKVFGNDCKKFLQGLISNNINLLDTKEHDASYIPNASFSSVASIYSGLFTNNGRYHFDFFVIKISNYYLIDIASMHANDFIKQLEFYTLISDVKIKIIPQLSVFAIFDHTSSNQLPLDSLKNIATNPLLNSNDNLENFSAIFKDSRLESMGYRVIANIIQDISLFYVKDSEYSYLCHINGIVDSLSFIPQKSIPLEYGFDELNAISYNKGCYLGQEFTNSSKNILAIRKRVVPIFMNNKVASCGDIIFAIINQQNSHKEKAGQVISQCRDYALVLLKMKYLNSSLYYEDTQVSPKLPSWVTTFSCE